MTLTDLKRAVFDRISTAYSQVLRNKMMDNSCNPRMMIEGGNGFSSYCPLESEHHLCPIVLIRICERDSKNQGGDMSVYRLEGKGKWQMNEGTGRDVNLQ